MLYWFLYPLAPDFPLFNVLRYITFRTAGATLTALLVCFLMGPCVIRWLKKKQKEGQPIREDGPESHLLTKQGTPTMGGGLILGSMVISIFLWGNLADPYIWIILFVITGFGIVGGCDDYMKLKSRSSKGVSAKLRLLAQITISGIATYFIMQLAPENHATTLSVPFFKDFFLDLGWFFVPFAITVVVGSANAVNLTDGLDGLAIVPVMITAVCFSIISYVVGHALFSEYLQLQYVAGAGEIAVICGAIIGASLGFLWFNAPPAMVFMGDTGSLPLGGALGSIAVITKHELVLFIIGGLFVIETVSVIIQVAYFKMTGKRIFLMAPIHHHFEKKGWAEPTIVIRFWIISIVLALIGMTTLKLR